MSADKFPTKSWLEAAKKSIDNALDDLDRIRDNFDMEWGEGAHTDLDVSLSHAIGLLNEAKAELSDTLDKFRGRKVRTSFPRKRTAKKEVTVADLQKALVC
jgi:hypothetical protein